MAPEIKTSIENISLQNISSQIQSFLKEVAKDPKTAQEFLKKAGNLFEEFLGKPQKSTPKKTSH